MAQWLHLQLRAGVSRDGVRVVDDEVISETHTPVNGIEQGLLQGDPKFMLGAQTRKEENFNRGNLSFEGK